MGKGIWFVLYLGLFLCLTRICLVLLPMVGQVEITAELDHEDILQVYYAGGINGAAFQEKLSVRSEPLRANRKEIRTFPLHNSSISSIRIDTGDQPGTAKIYSIAITTAGAKKIVFHAEDILQRFRPGGSQVSLQAGGDNVIVTSGVDDPSIQSYGLLLRPGLFVLYGVPLLLAWLVLAVSRQLYVAFFPKKADLDVKKPSMGSNIDALDGLRGLAAIMVVADHSWGRCTGLGVGGVWIFMCLSGFLLARPFIEQPRRALSASFLHRFFLRRALRILPVYTLYIGAIYLLNYRFDEAMRHLLFLQGSGHLWVIPQEILFYVLVPLIMLVNLLLWRNRIWPILGWLILAAVLCNHFLTSQVFSLYGMDNRSLPFFAGIFLTGLVASYAYHGVYQKMTVCRVAAPALQKGFAMLALVLAAGILCFSTARLWEGKLVYAQIYFPWFGVLAALLIFSIAAARSSRVIGIFTWFPLRAVGLVSFSLYVFHPLVMNVVRKAVLYYGGYNLSGFSLFAATLAASYPVACLAYGSVERPFLASHCPSV